MTVSVTNNLISSAKVKGLYDTIVRLLHSDSNRAWRFSIYFFGIWQPNLPDI